MQALAYRLNLGHDEEEGGHKKSSYDEADEHKEHHESGKKKKDGKHGHKKFHKKGSKTTGYHKKANKDEYHKEHKFYDDKHEEGKHKVNIEIASFQHSKQLKTVFNSTRNSEMSTVITRKAKANIRRDRTPSRDTKKVATRRKVDQKRDTTMKTTRDTRTRRDTSLITLTTRRAERRVARREVPSTDSAVVMEAVTEVVEVITEKQNQIFNHSNEAFMCLAFLHLLLRHRINEIKKLFS